MSNWSIVGIIGIITVICCLIAGRLTGNRKGVSIGGGGALLSAGGFGYAIAFLVRKGLTGPYLTVAVLVGIIVPVLIFLTLYNLVKEAPVKGRTDLKTSQDKQRSDLEKERISFLEDMDKQKLQLEAEHRSMVQAAAEEKRMLLQALAKEKKKLDEERTELSRRAVPKGTDMPKEYQERVKLLEQKKQEIEKGKQRLEKEQEGFEKEQESFEREKEGFEKEKEDLIQNIYNLNDCLDKMEEEKEDLNQTVQDLNNRLIVLQEEKEGFGAQRERIEKNFNSEKEALLERYEGKLKDLADELTSEREQKHRAVEKLEKMELTYRQKEIDEEKRRQAAADIRSRTDRKFDYENVMEKGRTLQKKGLYQLAITLYEECYEKVQDENQKNLLLKEIAGCYMDAGEPGKAKRVLAKG